MSEGPRNVFENKKPGREGWVREESARLKIEAMMALATELSESHETLPFPGIESAAYEKIKEGQLEDPGYSTPIDELIERFKSEGMKVALGWPSESGTIFILPAQSDNVVDDSIFPKHLQITEGMDEKLKELILLSRS